MIKPIDLARLLSAGPRGNTRQLGLFALLCLGVVETLSNGTASSTDATQFFFNADNCLFVRKSLANKTADKIMSHGAQLRDLFDALPAREAQQEFQRELTEIRSMCLRLLERNRLVA